MPGIVYAAGQDVTPIYLAGTIPGIYHAWYQVRGAWYVIETTYEYCKRETWRTRNPYVGSVAQKGSYSFRSNLIGDMSLRTKYLVCMSSCRDNLGHAGAGTTAVRAY